MLTIISNMFKILQTNKSLFTHLQIYSLIVISVSLDQLTEFFWRLCKIHATHSITSVIFIHIRMWKTAFHWQWYDVLVNSVDQSEADL